MNKLDIGILATYLFHFVIPAVLSHVKRNLYLKWLSQILILG